MSSLENRLAELLETMKTPLRFYEVILEQVREEKGSEACIELVLKNKGLQKRVARLLMTASREETKSSDYIHIPSISTADMFTLLEAKGVVNYRKAECLAWDFMKKDRGRKASVDVWKPEDDVTTEEVRAEWKKRQREGNVAAFLYWILQKDPEGNFVSIPPLDEDLRKGNTEGEFETIVYSRDEEHRSMHLLPTNGDTSWGKQWKQVGFQFA